MDQLLVVDHINKNGLDNRTKNLRVVDVSINNRNTNVRKTNIFNCRGITENQDRVFCYWYDLNKKKMSKSFSKKKYGREKAVEMAIQLRKQMEKENGYLQDVQRLSKRCKAQLSRVDLKNLNGRTCFNK